MERKQNYEKLNIQLSYMSDDELHKIIDKEQKTQGWGETSIIEIDKIKIFVKSIVLTDLEYKNKYDTSNLFNLPLFYNYGIGSAGINCWRELLMHKKTTQYVLSGQCVNFPLLYHYRIIETKPKKINFTLKKFKKWDSNKNIKEYMRCKSKTKYRILLLIEYFPKTIKDWIVEDLNNISSFYNQGFKIINFLNSKNIIHFDSHQGNFVVDINNNIYLTDYGLVLDKDFNLSDKELTFYNDNKYYDYGLLCSFIMQYLSYITSLKKQFYIDKLNIDEENTDPNAIYNIILSNYNFIFEHEKIKKPNKLSDIIEIAKIYSNFIFLMRNNNNKNNIFPNKQIQLVLGKTKILEKTKTKTKTKTKKKLYI